jgi:CheY-like chemotaxis protein
MSGRELVLVVDDDAVVRMLVSRILDQAGYRSIAVESALEALSALESQAPSVSLVLTDIMMPERTGLSLGEEVGRRWPGLPVVYMSGYTPDALMAKGVEVPPVFVSKPFTIEELLESVARSLSPSPLERRGSGHTPPTGHGPVTERRRVPTARGERG